MHKTIEFKTSYVRLPQFKNKYSHAGADLPSLPMIITLILTKIIFPITRKYKLHNPDEVYFVTFSGKERADVSGHIQENTS
jgi:hypothetical protein